MSKNQVELAETVLKDHFGELLAKLGAQLLKEGWSTLPVLALRQKRPIGQVKQCLQLLLQHNFADFKQNERAGAGGSSGSVEFSGDVNTVLLLVRFPWYLHTVKSLYGNQGELIVEDFFTNGQSTLSECVRRVFKLAEALNICKNVDEVKDTFAGLTETQFLRRCPELIHDPNNESSSSLSAVPIFREFKDPFLLPDKINISSTNESTQSKSKKRKLDENSVSDHPDAHISWRLNFDKFHRYLRDQLIVNYVDHMFRDKSADFMRSFLRLNELKSAGDCLCSQPLSANEAYKLIPSSLNLAMAQMMQYLNAFTDDKSQFFRKVGESGGGLFAIDFSNATKLLAQNCSEDIVRERFGSKALRIFRLLLIKGYLEQNEIENMAMLPSKDAKELTYRLLTEGFVYVKEVPKTNDFAPSRTFYLFYVNLPQLARKLIDCCYKTISNLIMRREYEFEQNKALLERQERLDAIVANIQQDPNLDQEVKSQHVADVEDAYISVAEKEILRKYRKIVSKIQQAEIETDQTVFVLRQYLQYIPRPVVNSARKRTSKQ